MVEAPRDLTKEPAERFTRQVAEGVLSFESIRSTLSFYRVPEFPAKRGYRGLWDQGEGKSYRDDPVCQKKTDHQEGGGVKKAGISLFAPLFSLKPDRSCDKVI